MRAKRIWHRILIGSQNSFVKWAKFIIESMFCTLVTITSSCDTQSPVKICSIWTINIYIYMQKIFIQNYDFNWRVRNKLWRLGITWSFPYCSEREKQREMKGICRKWEWDIIMTSWWVRWRPKSPASRLLTHPFVQAQIKENTKGLRHWPLWGEFTGGWWIPRTKGQWCRKCFQLMTSSWRG